MNAPSALLCLVTAVGVAAACSDNKPVPTTAVPPIQFTGGGCTGWGQWWSGNASSDVEEEVFGVIVGDSTATWAADLGPRDQETTANQVGYFSPTMPVNFGDCQPPLLNDGHLNNGAEWGWYAPGQNPQCSTTGVFTNNEPEHHRDRGFAFPVAYEAHCLKAGHFTLTLEKGEATVLARPIDAIAYDADAYPPGWTIKVEKESPFTGTGFVTTDLMVDYDEQTTGPPATANVEITAVADRADPSWSPLSLQSGSYRAPSNFWLRFSAALSVPAAGYSSTQLLVRYFWEWGVDPNSRSNFTNSVSESRGLARIHQFSVGVHTVRAHVVQPREKPTVPDDETSTAYGSILDLPLNIYGPLTSSITVNTPQPVELGQPATFTAGGSNGAGGNQYRWEFGAGEGVIDWSSNANPSYTFLSAGSKTVTLRKRDTYGYVAVGTAAVNVVQATPLTASIHGMYSNQNGAVRQNQLCTWRGDATGGIGTYSYTWYKNNVLVGTGHLFEMNSGSTSFTLKLTVQSGSQSVNSTKSISVTANGQICA